MAGTGEPVAVLGIGAMRHGMAASAVRAGIPTMTLIGCTMMGERPAEAVVR